MVLFKAKKSKYDKSYMQLPGVAAGQAYTPVDDIARLPIIRGMCVGILILLSIDSWLFLIWLVCV
jgi:hypothetical protein